MDLREQVVRFKALLQEHDLQVDDFALNVNSDAFKGLLDGDEGCLEVRCRKTGMAIDYKYDGTVAWLEILAEDLAVGKFQLGDR